MSTPLTLPDPITAEKYVCFDAEVVELSATWEQDQFCKDSQDSSDMPEPDYTAAIGCIEQLKYFALEHDMASLLKICMSGEDIIFESSLNAK